jgi:hypothetical protein
MSNQLTFVALAEKVLREEKRPLSPREIWQLAVAKQYDKQLDSDGKTPKATLYTVIFKDARDNPRTPFYKVGQRPARYFLKALKHTINPDTIEEATPMPEGPLAPLYDYKESDLHPFLSYFAHVHFKAFTKTIRHIVSKKKEFGEWVHPDMVGVHYPLEDWSPEVLSLSTATGNTGLKLYSFELKKTLGFPNLREAFFQAVSNSSWANEGYLAAADISDEDDFLSELRRLSAAFGIGVINVSLEDPDTSTVLFPARERDVVDWDTVNKLTMNKDVKELLVRVKNDLNNKEVIQEKYDKILTPEELSILIKKEAAVIEQFNTTTS